MKLAFALLVVLFGLVAVNSFSIHDVEKEAEEEITSLDDAIHKSKVLKKVLAAVESALSHDGVDKRFLSGLLDKIKELGKKLADYFTNIYKQAREKASKYLTGVGFAEAVANLDKIVTSKTTESVCISKCEGAAGSILGSLAGEASKLCAPCCRGALAKLHDLAA